MDAAAKPPTNQVKSSQKSTPNLDRKARAPAAQDGPRTKLEPDIAGACSSWQGGLCQRLFVCYLWYLPLLLTVVRALT